MHAQPIALATLLAASTATAQMIYERTEPNDSAATATFLPLGAQAWGNLDSSNTDVDWYRITLTGVSDIKVWTGPGTLHSFTAVDTVIRLYDGIGTLLGTYDQGDPSETGDYASFVFGSLVPGDFYLAVTGLNATDIGTYTLRIDGPIPPIVAPSTVTMHPGGCAGSAGVPKLGVYDNHTTPASYAERPVLGSPYVLTGTDLPYNTLTFQVIGLLPAAAPIDLALYGAPGCRVVVEPTSSEMGLTGSFGTSYWALQLPLLPQLVGLPLAQQIMILDPAANALGFTTSNHVTSVCGFTH